MGGSCDLGFGNPGPQPLGTRDTAVVRKIGLPNGDRSEADWHCYICRTKDVLAAQTSDVAGGGCCVAARLRNATYDKNTS